jgi:hypothetical protein
MFKALISLIMLGLILTGCDGSKNISGSNNPETLKEAMLQPRPQLEAGKDYSKNVSGKWLWVAKKSGKVVGMGQFILVEQAGKVAGMNQVLAPGLKPKAGKIAVVNIPLKGNHDRAGHVQFTIKDNGGITTDNVATLAENGTVLKGHSFAMSGKSKEVEYDWEANRVTG